MKLLIALALMLCACNLGADAVIQTATPGGAGSFAPTVPAPTATPPDPIPGAATALLVGDYDTARTLYTSASASTTPTLKCAALYGLGVTNLRAGQPTVDVGQLTTAESALTRSLTECPPTFQSYVQRAEARRLLGKKSDAISDYQAALVLAPGLIDSYLYQRMSLVDGTTLYLLKAAAAPRYLAGQFALHDQLAQAFIAANDPVDALKEYDAILAQATLPGYRAQVEIEAANVQIKAGQLPAAYVRLNSVLTSYPDSTAAFNAMVTLVTANQPVDILLRTRLNVANSNFPPVISYLPDYLSATPADKIPAELYLLLGQAQRGTGDTASALATFQKVRDSYPADPLASSAALEQGRTQFIAKNYPAAIAAYSAAAAAYPKSADAPEALWRAGYIAQTQGTAADAVALYDQLGSHYPGTDRATQGLFNAGMLLSATDPVQAAAFFGRAGDAHGLLWQGKMLLKAKDIKGARLAWTAAAAKEPGTFFSLRAADLLSGAIPYQATGFRLATSTAAERSVAEAWIAKTFGLPGAVSSVLAPTLAHDPLLTRGTELWALGWYSDATAEFDALHTAHKDDPLAMYQLALYYQSIGVNRSSILAASRVIVLSKVQATAVPVFIARLAYSIDYADTLVASARAYNLDPLFFCSLIRLESDFDAQAQSGSDARGLTQIVPVTAADIVGHLNWPPNYTDNDLFRPFISLKMGAFYVDFVRRYLGGNLAATLAGYNAGPGAALNWLQQSGDDLDQLYETIDQPQANDYVRITYENNAVYRALYGKP